MSAATASACALQKNHLYALADARSRPSCTQHGADHLMDNFPRRTPPAARWPVARPRKRLVTGGRIAATLQATPALTVDIGLDTLRNAHEGPQRPRA